MRSLRAWARHYGVHHSTFIQRVRRGMTIEEAGTYQHQSSGMAVSSDGYRINGRSEKLHILAAEKALGRKLRKGECVHHIDGDKLNNENSNLLVCDVSFHNLIHQRMRAIDACGHADWRKCQFCGEYDRPENLYIPPKRGTVHHRSCRREYERNKK